MSFLLLLLLSFFLSFSSSSSSFLLLLFSLSLFLSLSNFQYALLELETNGQFQLDQQRVWFQVCVWQPQIRQPESRHLCARAPAAQVRSQGHGRADAPAQLQVSGGPRTLSLPSNTTNNKNKNKSTHARTHASKLQKKLQGV